MYRDGWIEADPVWIACYAPNRNALRVKLAHQSASYVAGGSGGERAVHVQEASRGASYALVGPAYLHHPGFASVICVTPIRRSVNPASQ